MRSAFICDFRYGLISLRSLYRQSIALSMSSSVLPLTMHLHTYLKAQHHHQTAMVQHTAVVAGYLPSAAFMAREHVMNPSPL